MTAKEGLSQDIASSVISGLANSRNEAAARAPRFCFFKGLLSGAADSIIRERLKGDGASPFA